MSKNNFYDGVMCVVLKLRLLSSRLHFITCREAVEARSSWQHWTNLIKEGAAHSYAVHIFTYLMRGFLLNFFLNIRVRHFRFWNPILWEGMSAAKAPFLGKREKKIMHRCAQKQDPFVRQHAKSIPFWGAKFSQTLPFRWHTHSIADIGRPPLPGLVTIQSQSYSNPMLPMKFSAHY